MAVPVGGAGAEGTKYPSNFDQFKKTSPFTAETLTKKDHDEPELHFIGDALPPPTLVSAVKSIGITPESKIGDVGTSPIPAREDHRHIYTGVSSTITTGINYSGVTEGNGTHLIRWARAGRIFFLGGRFTLGSTSAITGDITLDLSSVGLPQPLIQSVGSARVNIGAGIHLADCVVTATLLFVRQIRVPSTPAVGEYAVNASGPGTWAESSFFEYSIVYPTADFETLL